MRIITDSASDITLRQAKELNIHIVPISIQFQDGPCPQETDADLEQFYIRLAQAEELPSTSQPSPELYLEQFEAAKEAGDEVLVLTLSSGLSGTINAAQIAREMCGYDPVYIVDSRQAIASQRILVEYAVSLRSEGLPAPQIVDKLEALRDRITVNGVIDTLTYLRKGGRIPAGLAVVGNAMRIKPVIVLEDKILKTIGKALGREAGKRMLYQRFEKHLPDPDFPLYFLYTSDKQLGQQFMEETIEKFQLQNFQTSLIPVGGVIGTHVGTNAMGIAYVMK
ncbi:MAG: DegV family protein [Oscillospiraceae bacterium]|nr:DegV family protein [Oscillospiraceae bacterium]